MSNARGFPVWYELLTNDAAASRAFFQDLLGWKVEAPNPEDPKKYEMLRAEEGYVGGMMQLTDEMRAQGAKPTWLFYLGVDDVDATAKQIEGAGGKITMPPFDVPEAGRIAMVADPQGLPFYVMTPSGNGTSTAFERSGMGKCNWNELATPDQAAANDFYAKVFGWTYPDKMKMPNGEYVFASVGGTVIGATMPVTEGAPSGWQFYFRAPNIDVAAEKVKKAGGKVHAGPMEVPGGDKVIVASDPQGVPFGVAAPGKASS